MSVIRKITKIIIGRDSTSNTAQNLGGTDETYIETSSGVETVSIEETVSLHCGCFGQPGGRCQVCGVVSCVKCHQHCGGQDNPTSLGCGKPICRQHSDYMILGNMNLPFCSQCKAKIKRKLARQKITGLLVSPFIEQEVKNEKQ